MPQKAILYEDFGTTWWVDIPLTSTVNPEEIGNELGIPSYVDMNYHPMRSAVVTLWAALQAPELHKLHPEAFERKISDKPIPVLLFGGAAAKIRCQHANGTSSLSRAIKDTDFIVPKKQGSDFYRFLCGLYRAFGTQYMSFCTKSDRMFSALRHGERYRVRTINGVASDGTPSVTVMDIFCDAINLRHKVDVRDAFGHYKENLYTVGLENLILSKAQFIMDFPADRIDELKQAQQEHRILNYPHYSKDRIILGMEEKDIRDICAIFIDHAIGSGIDNIDSEKMREKLERDSKLALTTRLNLQNIVEKSWVVEKWLKKNEAETVVNRVQTVLESIPKVDKKWDKPWWNTAVETPVIS